MTSSVRNIFNIPELRKRLLFTMGLLVVFRIGCLLPVPGVNAAAVSDLITSAQGGQGAFGAVFGMMNLFTGGALRYMALFSLGVMPYISASIIIQLLTTSVPFLEALSKEGEAGRKKIRRIERYLTVALCIFQAYVFVRLIEGMSQTGAGPSIISPELRRWQFELLAILGMTAGSIFLMWVGEQMTEYGIGNGVSMIIMAGIIARAPLAVWDVVTKLHWGLEAQPGEMSILMLLVMMVLFVAIIMGVVLITQAQRRIPMQQAKQTRGRRVYGGQRHYMPLRVNQAGVIPIIFASSLLVFPSLVIRSLQNVAPRVYNWLAPMAGGRGFLYITLYAGLIIFFCFFWTAVTFNPQQMSDNLRDYGSFIPGIRPGRNTAQYLERVMMRITMAGGVFLAIIAILPTILSNYTNLQWQVTGFFGGTGLLIVVGVALDFVERIETHLLMRHYEGFMRKGRIRGRR